MSGGHHHHAHHHDAVEVRSRPVVLDLGGDVGALIVHTDPELAGIEVEISPSGNDAERQHKQVLRRMLGGDEATVLVYDNLPAGDYTLWVDGEPWAHGVRVNGGKVVVLDQRDATETALA
jgi:hypothetical protein